MRIVLEIARSFRDRVAPWTADELSDHLRVPVRTVRDVLVPLHEAKIVAALDPSEKEDGMQLGAPAETIELVDVLVALRGPRENVAGDPQLEATVEQLLGELGEAETKAAAGRTVADLVARLPVAPARD